MKAQEFVTWAENVFGKYTSGMKGEVVAWLAPHEEYFITAICNISVKEHPSVYGRPPGVFELERMKEAAYEEGHRLEARASLGKRKELTSDAEEARTPEQQAEIDAMVEGLKKKLGV